MTANVLPVHLRYFTSFLPSLTGQLLIEDLRDLSATFEIRLTDLADPAWKIHIDQGRIGTVSQTGPEAPCGFELGSETFLKIVGGRLGAQDAFFQGDVDIRGDIELGLKLSTVLEPFFKRFPFTP